MCTQPSFVFFFFFNDTATTEIYPLSLHDALPISRARRLPHGDVEPEPRGRQPGPADARGASCQSRRMLSERRGGPAFRRPTRFLPHYGRPLARPLPRFSYLGIPSRPPRDAPRDPRS